MQSFNEFSFKKLLRLTDELLFPNCCPVCKEALPLTGSSQGYTCLICPECLSTLPFIDKNLSCQKCGRGLNESSFSHGFCKDCREHIRSFEKGFSLFRYDEEIREIMSDIKYRGRQEFCNILSLLFYEQFKNELKALSIDAVIPVPVHENRLKKRGFNQAEALASPFAQKLGVPLNNEILFRVKDTKASKQLGYEGRILNLQEAFYADPTALGDAALGDIRTVLLFDDIYTTGATLECCTEALLRAGAKKVYCATICSGVS